MRAALRTSSAVTPSQRPLIEKRLIAGISHLPEIQNRFRRPHKKDPSRFERFKKASIQLILCFLGKINDHISAQNQIKILFKGIFEEIMPLKFNTTLDIFLNGIFIVRQLIKILLPTRSSHPYRKAGHSKT